MVGSRRDREDGPTSEPGPHEPWRSNEIMAGIATLLGILLIIVAIPFGLMFAPLALGIVVVALAWRHVAATYEHDGLAV